VGSGSVWDYGPVRLIVRSIKAYIQVSVTFRHILDMSIYTSMYNAA
jgi:hypothetical protein